MFLGKFSEACRAKTSTATRLHHPGVTRRGTRSLLTPSGSYGGGYGGALQRNFGVFLVSVMPASLFSRHSQVFLRAERSHWLLCPNMAESDWMPPMASFLSLLRMFSAGNKATLRDYTGFITSKLGALLRGKWLLLLFREFLHSHPQKCTAKLNIVTESKRNIVTEAFHLFIFIDWRHSIDQREPNIS